jgi:hypothetical protein
MTEIKIGSKTYKIEYSVESALYGNCTEKVAEFFTNGATAQGKDAIKSFISTIADLPKLALEMFYAGLMEHHGENGDRTVLSVDDARALLTKLIKDNKGEELGNFYGIIGVLMGQMADDGFFDMIGLRQITEGMNQTKKALKAPQDHKKKNA